MGPQKNLFSFKNFKETVTGHPAKIGHFPPQLLHFWTKIFKQLSDSQKFFGWLNAPFSSPLDDATHVTAVGQHQ